MDNEKNKNNKTDSIKDQTIEYIEEISEDIIQDLKKIEKDKVGLVVIKGPIVGEKFFLTKSILNIGRSIESDILLDDITVSRKHAVIKKSNGNYTISDLGSLNGTYINSKRVDYLELCNGDRIQIGKYIFLFFSF
jgi:pSer/pThr/pTyr-binding forkhead associated (FHA) protein